MLHSAPFGSSFIVGLQFRQQKKTNWRQHEAECRRKSSARAELFLLHSASCCLQLVFFCCLNCRPTIKLEPNGAECSIKSAGNHAFFSILARIDDTILPASPRTPFKVSASVTAFCKVPSAFSGCRRADTVLASNARTACPADK